ncbi:MAG: DUF4914 domain-containing protein [Epulopiscium sp. Nele67-Bin004]|nr:MAG: DUF4914 domain-containing protein [Epulopiscium sp. Nele67-Bin004]
MKSVLEKMILPQPVKDLLAKQNRLIVPESREHLLELAMGGAGNKEYTVSYDVEGVGEIVEARVVKCKNGVAVNYMETHMRRRDPNCMVISDTLPTDKTKYIDRFGVEFDETRQQTLDWLDQGELIVMAFMSGGHEYGYESLLIAPANTGFFAAALADLQGLVPLENIRDGFKPRAILYVAPPFRHTHYEGKQVVVHHRSEGMHEVFAYNLYPGPSAKKGIYGVLLTIGEAEGWVTLHASTVRVITPYENVFTIMHEGASGGGKSEMIEQIHTDIKGKMALATNLITGDSTYMDVRVECELHPVTDDMAIVHPSYQAGTKLMVTDGEEGWFLRVNHITGYGTDPYYEKMCVHPKEPLIFLNMEASPDSTCLIWEHTIDEDLGKPCPNPRIIIPRRRIDHIVNEPVEVDIRSFGVRAPSCTKDNPTYGIMGMFHVLPPALAWLWRLVAPRGHANPSILDSDGMKSEGVGSYWPFATGRKVEQANLLLKQILNTPDTGYILIPNQHIGAYEVGFRGQWITREYLARRGSTRFNRKQLVESRCPLLGYAPANVRVDGFDIPTVLLDTSRQPEIGLKGYDEGAKILYDFFRQELTPFLSDQLHPLGRVIIEYCLKNAKVEDYEQLLHFR